MDSFILIALTAVDVDSPLDEPLMTALRSRDEHLAQWLGQDFTPAPNHNHDGVNSTLLPANIAAALYLYDNFS